MENINVDSAIKTYIRQREAIKRWNEKKLTNRKAILRPIMIK